MVKTRLLPAFTLALGLSAILIACSNDSARSAGRRCGGRRARSATRRRGRRWRAAAAASYPATAEGAKQFVEAADKELLELGNKVARAQWVAATYITEDTEALSADAYQQFIAAHDAPGQGGDALRQLRSTPTRAPPEAAQAREHAAAGAVRRRPSRRS